MKTLGNSSCVIRARSGLGLEKEDRDNGCELCGVGLFFLRFFFFRTPSEGYFINTLLTLKLQTIVTTEDD